MSEDAPQGTPGDEAATTPEPPVTPEPAVTPEPPAEMPAAPAAEAPTVATPATPAAPTAGPTGAAPGTPGYAAPTVAAPTVAAPMAMAPVAPAPAHPHGFFIPRWVGYLVIAIVGILVVGGIGYAIGHETSSSNSSNAGADFPRNFPGLGNGNRNMPAFPGFGNGNGNQNGNGNGNGNGNQNGGNASGGFLGVAIQDASTGSGAQVTSVQSSSPAANAGLKTGDVITKVDSTDIANAAALAQAIRSHAAGDTVTVTYTRDGNAATATVTLGNAANAQVQPS